MIELHISATSPQELIETINGLATLGSANRTVRPAAETEEEAVPQAEAPKATRGRRQKGSDDAAPATPPSEAQLDTAEAEPDGSGPTVTELAISEQSAKVETPPAEAGEVVALDAVREALSKACAPGGKTSMREAQDHMKNTYKQVNGDPVRRLSELQVKDYALLMAWIGA